MKRTLLVLTISAGLMGSGYAHAEKWLVGGGERVLGKKVGKLFVPCEGTKPVDLIVYPKMKIVDAPNMFCHSSATVDSAISADDYSDEQPAKDDQAAKHDQAADDQAAKDERKKVEKILSAYRQEHPEPEPQ